MITLKMVGQMDNSIDHTHESANRVYDPNGLAPTLNTCGGGNLEPKILVMGVCPKVVGQLPGNFESSNRIYDVTGICPTLTSLHGGGGVQPKIMITTYTQRERVSLSDKPQQRDT